MSSQFDSEAGFEHAHSRQQSQGFDPEKVERGYFDECSKFHASHDPSDMEAVRASDYDKLLALYLTYKEAFEDVMYQEFSSNQTHINNFLEDARKTVNDRLSHDATS